MDDKAPSRFIIHYHGTSRCRKPPVRLLLPGIDGMLHISQISDKRLAKVTDVLQVGDEINVRLDAIDDKGRLSLSMKGVDQKS